MDKAWIAFAGFLGLIVIGILGFMLFVTAAGISGNIDHEYRCAQYGIVEQRSTYFGHGLAKWEPINGEDNTLCQNILMFTPTLLRE